MPQSFRPIRGLSCRLVVVSIAGTLLVAVPAHAVSPSTTVHPQLWPRVSSPLPADPALDARVKALLDRMSVEDKVGQMIQADIKYVTPEDVRQYRLGSILAGGNYGLIAEIITFDSDVFDWFKLPRQLEAG